MSAVYGIPYEELGMQQQEAEAMSAPETDRKTCAELSCDECNERHRRLERERNALRSELAEAQGQMQWCEKGKELLIIERDALRSQLAGLREALSELISNLNCRFNLDSSWINPDLKDEIMKARAALKSTAETV